MAHEGRKPVEPRLRVDALPVPAHQASHRERVPQAVKTGRGDAVGDREGELGDEPVERLARGARVHAASAVEAEERVLTSPAAALGLAGEELAEARPVGDEAALAVMPTSA